MFMDLETRQHSRLPVKSFICRFNDLIVFSASEGFDYNSAAVSFRTARHFNCDKMNSFSPQTALGARSKSAGEFGNKEL